MNEKGYIRINIVLLILICLCSSGVVALLLGRAYHSPDARAGREFEAAAELNRSITEEQRITIDGIEYSAGELRISLEAVGRIRSLTAEADTALRELGLVNRGSSDISEAIRAEAFLLADYFRGVSSVLGDIDHIDE